jgi:uncharacterized protein
MRLDDLDPSNNVEDMGRGGGGFGGFSGGGGGGGGLISLLFGILPLLLGRKMGWGTILLIGAAAAFFMFSGGGLNLAGPAPGPATSSQQSAGGNVACDNQEELFACRVLKSTEDTWASMFGAAGQKYPAPRLKFYQGGGQSGCGAAQSEMGPFYCPSDQGIYIDTSFFQQMERQMGAGGDFAKAYVIAHEVGHHIQTVTGISERVRGAQARASQAEGNSYQVRMELQADCYAGVWAARNADRIEPGDIEEGMTAANAIGDDTLMRQAGQRPVESMFTHGTSEQRMTWLKKGLQSGNPKACDTFTGVL